MIRKLRSRTSLLILAGLTALVLSAQSDSQRLPRREAVDLYREIAGLMEATATAAPELARAGAPLIENVRRSAEALQTGTTQEHAGILYRLLLNARIYLDVSGAVPRPAAFADDIQKQLAQLRSAVDRAEQHFQASLDAKESQLRSGDRDNLQRYAEANRQLGPPAPSEKRVVFLGDSITDGWQLNQYFPGKPYINRGISGQITGQMLGRMTADVLDLKPAAVLILAGTNDIARGVPPEAIKDNLTMIADLALAHDLHVIVASVLPISDYHKDQDPSYERSPQRPPSTILELNRWIQQMCQARDFIYLDYFSAMVDTNGFLQAPLADDGLHPNAAGYRVMAPLAAAAIDRALRAPAAPAQKRKRFGIF